MKTIRKTFKLYLYIFWVSFTSLFNILATDVNLLPAPNISDEIIFFKQQLDITDLPVDKVFSNGPVRYKTPNGEYITRYETQIRRDKNDGTKIYYHFSKNYYKVKFSKGREYVVFVNNLGANTKSLIIYRYGDGRVDILYGKGNMSFSWPSNLVYHYNYYENRIQIGDSLINLIFHSTTEEEQKRAQYFIDLIIFRHPDTIFSQMMMDSMQKGIQLNDAQSAFLHAYNYFRNLSGLQPIVIDEKLENSAMNHATYCALVASGHSEDPKNSYFTGKTPMERAKRVGFTGSNLGEVVSISADPYSIIESFLHTLFHRIGVLQPEINSAGFGYFVGENSKQKFVTKGVINYARKKGSGPRFVVFPFDGMQGVPPGWNSNESPNPFILLKKDPSPTGFPVTVYFRGHKPLENSVLQIFNNKGQLIDCYTDFGSHRRGDIVALIPKNPLNYNTLYTIQYSYVENGLRVVQKSNFKTCRASADFNSLVGLPDFIEMYKK